MCLGAVEGDRGGPLRVSRNEGSFHWPVAHYEGLSQCMCPHQGTFPCVLQYEGVSLHSEVVEWSPIAVSLPHPVPSTPLQLENALLSARAEVGQLQSQLQEQQER